MDHQRILNSIKFCDKFYKRTKLTDPDSTKYQTLHEKFKAYNSILQRNINQANELAARKSLRGIPHI